MQPEMNAWRDYISHEIDDSNELNANINCPKINMISDWVKRCPCCGILRQYSAERHQHVHNINLKDGWNPSNHNVNYLPQVITFQHRICCLDITVLNHRALAPRRETTADRCNVLPFGAGLAAPLSSQSHLVLATSTKYWVGSGSSSTQNRTVATDLNTHKPRTVGNGPVLPPKSRHFKFTVLPPIKYLSSDCITTQSICTLCSYTGTFTFQFQICDSTSIRSVGIENPLLLLQICYSFPTTQRISVRLQV